MLENDVGEDFALANSVHDDEVAMESLVHDADPSIPDLETSEALEEAKAAQPLGDLTTPVEEPGSHQVSPVDPSLLETLPFDFGSAGLSMTLGGDDSALQGEVSAPESRDHTGPHPVPVTQEEIDARILHLQ